jgi:archaellum component FlaC
MAELAELTIRMDTVEKSLEREIGKRENSEKYTHRMIEDVQSRYQDIAVSFGRIEASFTQHLKDDKQMTQSLLELDKRVRTVERLTWIAVGGIAVIGGLIALVGSQIIGKLT